MGIARGTVLNLIGLAAPLPLAVLVVPSLLDHLGTEGFALLTLLWVLSAYTGVFDLGLGRALTQKLATALEQGLDSTEVGALCGTALTAMLVLGLLIGLALLLGAGTLVGLLDLQARQASAVTALQVLAASVPLMLLGAGSRGALEALLAFGRVNAVRLPLGVWTLLGPWLAVQQGFDLVGISCLLALGRIVAAVAWTWMAWRALPAWRRHPGPARRWLRPLLRSGSWLTIGNLVGPLMGYADRFLVAALLSVAAAAHYATPQELVSKLWVLPGALMAVMFPAMAQQLVVGGPELGRLCAVALRWIVLICLPLSLGLALAAFELLSVWLGADFALPAAPVLRWMALGMFLGCVAQLPFTLLQSADAASVTAKLHLVQLPLFLLAMIWVVPRTGVAGAAAVWALRNGLDAVCLFLLCRRRFADLQLWPAWTLPSIGLFSGLAFAGTFLDAAALRFIWWLSIGLLLFLVAWRRAELLRFSTP